MNWLQHKRMILILLFLAAALLCTGFQKESVALLESGLIDLDKAIGTAPFGITDPDANGGPSEIEEPAEEDPSGGENTDDPTSEEYDSEEFISLRIRGETIYLGQETLRSDQLREELKSRVKYDKPVRLFDDYADAATYERVLEILEDLHRSVGLVYET